MKLVLNVLCRIGGAILVFVCSILAAVVASTIFAVRVLRGEVTAKQMLKTMSDGGDEMISKYDIL